MIYDRHQLNKEFETDMIPLINSFFKLVQKESNMIDFMNKYSEFYNVILSRRSKNFFYLNRSKQFSLIK